MKYRLFVWAILMGLWASLLAQWSTDPTQNTPVCTVSEDQKGVQVVPDGRGGAIFVWYDKRNGTDWDLYAQRLDRSGYPQWHPDGVPVVTSSGHQWGHRAISDGQGGVLVVWQDTRNGLWDIYAQRVDSSGQRLWAIDGVPVCTASGDQEYPAPLADGTGGLVIAWEDKRAGSTPDIYAQRLDAQGNPLWAANGLAVCTAANHQRRPRLAPAPGNGCYVVWYDYRGTTLAAEIYLQRLAADGTALWQTNGIAVTNSPADDTSPRILPDGQGGVVLAWSNGDVLAQRVDSTGSLLWGPDGLLVCDQPGNQWGIETVRTAEDAVGMAWVDERQGVLDASIYAQKISLNGSLLWASGGVPVCTATGQQLLPRVSSDDSGGVLIAWQDNRAGARNADVYAQRIKSSGQPAWLANGVPISLADNAQLFVGLISDGRGNGLVGWEDNRTGSQWDVYAQRIRASGQLGPDPPTGIRQKQEIEAIGIRLLPAYPNPFNGTLNIPLRVNSPGNLPVKVSIVDVQGRNLQTVFRGILPPGNHRLRWDGNSRQGYPLPTGCYFIRIQQGSRLQVQPVQLVR